MKKIFKLAAIAVSMALVASLVACSSGDDDVVDASTPKYLVTAQIDKFVASIEYDQNVSDKEIEGLKKAHKAVMDIIGDCEDCLEDYFLKLKDYVVRARTEYWHDNDQTGSYLDYFKSDDFEAVENKLNCLKSSYAKEDDYHKMYVYRPAINEALDAVEAAWRVYRIGDATVANENSILKGELNERQAANMKAYIDAAAALKAALSDDDKKTCKTTIDAADKAIETFGKLENKNVTTAKIEDVTDAVWKMCEDISTKVCDTIYDKYNKLENDYWASLKK